MSYPDISSDDFVQNLLRRKEFYSLKADPVRNFRDPPESINDPLTGKHLKIHSHQLFARNFENPNTPYKSLHLLHSTGCHSIDTPILMYDGSIKMVQDVAVGDQLMGDDSTPRNVLQLARGRETMFKIIPKNGPTFICNASHILSLKRADMIIDIGIKHIVNNPELYSLYRVGVDFPEKQTEIDPYLLGFWLFSESSFCFEIVTKFSPHVDMHIPHTYKCNSRRMRLKLLAGVIDSAGYYDAAENVYILTHSHRRLIDDIIYLCRSLGLTVYKYNDNSVYNEITITGNISQIPVTIDHKKASAGQCDNISFTLEQLPIDDYYGFILDNNHRYLLGDFTVTHNSGKTLGAVAFAQEFVKIYKKIYASAQSRLPGRRHYLELDKTTPTIFVLGFGGTKAAFVRELLRYPEFGFITISEKEELIKRQKLAEAGLPDDIRQLRDYYNFLKKRITNKTKDGFYRFYGYQEFVNRLFLSDDIKLTELEAQAIQKLRAGENVTLEDIIYQHIESGKIQVNTQLLQQFENSLLICDEIHNTYNMNMKNNYGVAIQFVRDSTPSLRLLTMSATPINNSPTEVVELINYLVPSDQKITKKEFFENSRTLRPGKLQKLGELSRGRISYLQDVSLKYFPKREFMGEQLILPKDVENFRAGEAIPYLKFIPCPMSKIHQATYFHHLEMVDKGEIKVDDVPVVEESSERVPGVANAAKELKAEHIDITVDLESDDDILPAPYIDEETVDEPAIGAPKYSYHSIPTDGYSIYDIAFPNPDSEQYGLFRSAETRNKIAMASQEWRDKNKVMIKKVSALNTVITGDFLLRENIRQWSTKNATVIDIIHQIIAESGGNPEKCQKTMIYHDRVKMSGVLHISELLLRNNFLDEHSEPVDGTICCICGKPMISHTTSSEKLPAHEFRPVRFVIAHSDIDKTIMEQSLAKYSSHDNAHGLKYAILVGSKIIKESYDFKDIQNIIVAALPINIPTMIQVLGRAIRKNSHINLPPDQRRVRIFIPISTINKDYPHPDDISPEMYRCIDKLADYIAIQLIERELNRNTIDADIHRDINMPPELLKQYFPHGKTSAPVNILGNLYFEPAVKLPEYKLSELNLSTWDAYNYNDEEIKTISWIIKRLFMRQPVWTYDDLWEAVRQPPYGVEMNPKLFAEGNFVISLHNLVSSANQIVSANKQRGDMSEMFLIERIFDYTERFIYLHGQRHKIEHVGRYYILFPVAATPANPLSVVYTEYLEHTRDRDRALFKQIKEPDEKVIIDVESYLRPLTYHPGVRINIDAYVRESKAGINYASKRGQFLERYREVDDITAFLSDYNVEFQISILEEAILAQVLGVKATETSPELEKLYAKVIALFDRFDVIIRLAEIRKYKDTAKQYKYGLPTIGDNTPLGYMLAKSIRLYDPQIEKLTKGKATAEDRERGRWFEVSKIALNRHRVYKENEIIIGYLESAEDHMKFKLRKPVHIIKDDIAKEAAARKLSKSELDGITSTRQAVGDTRLIERGIVCGTKNKYELLKIIASLGISTSKLDKSQNRIKRLCDIIKTRLMEKEAQERQKDTKYKYFYGFWSEMPQLS